MMITILVAAIAGSLLPGLLRSLGIDPAIAGGVVLTTITEVVAFLFFSAWRARFMPSLGFARHGHWRQ